jgi:hypothetical protein
MEWSGAGLQNYRTNSDLIQTSERQKPADMTCAAPDGGIAGRFPVQVKSSGRM